MLPWQRRARLAVGLFAAAFALGLVLTMGEREQPVALAPVERLDPAAAVEIRGGNALRLRGAARDFSIRYESSLTYEDGRSRFLDAEVTVEDRGNRDFEIAARELVVGSDQRSFEMLGGVTLSASDGLALAGERATYTDTDGRLAMSGAARFSRGAVAGTGHTLTYERGREAVSVGDDVQVQVAAGAAGPAMAIEAGAGEYLRLDRVLRFARGVAVTRGGEALAAEAATIWLWPAADHPATIELRGGARVAGIAGGALPALEAEVITLYYDESGPALRQAVLAGGARLELLAGGAGRQHLAAEWIDVALAPGGTVTALAARGRVEVALSAGADVPARRIRAERLSASGAAGGGLASMRFDGQVAFEETPSTGGERRAAQADALELRLDGAGALELARFAGRARFAAGTLEAAAGEAEYDVARGRLVLAGPDAGSAPRVRDAGMALEGERLTVGLETGTLAAAGSVRSVLDGGGDRARPALLDAGQPVHVAAGALEYDRGAGRGTYTGAVRLWQGDTAVQAAALTLDERAGALAASGGVRAALALGSEVPSTARASALSYDDETRRLALDGAAELDSPAGTVRAARIDVRLQAGARAIAHLEARGSVSVSLGDRTATGAELAYAAVDDRYDLRGAPVRLVDPCREITGRALTFFGAVATILVDGNEETRTQTKGGGTCPDPRFE